ncbi:MAG: stage sporulation protein [Firmicutes bacterium]|nr:stage sporulation protein [Bacillota bacterium]
MWIKLAGGVLVLLVSSCIGFQLAARCSGRPQHIRQIVSCLGSLKSYITYASLPLHEALSQCTHGTYGPVAEFFHHTATLLEQNGGLSPQQAINIVLGDMQGRLILKQSELEILGILGANLGIMNRQEQGNYLSMIIEELEKLESEAARLRDLNTRMYRYLGICGGLAIVILLV